LEASTVGRDSMHKNQFQQKKLWALPEVPEVNYQEVDEKGNIERDNQELKRYQQLIEDDDQDDNSQGQSNFETNLADMEQVDPLSNAIAESEITLWDKLKKIKSKVRNDAVLNVDKLVNESTEEIILNIKKKSESPSQIQYRDKSDQNDGITNSKEGFILNGSKRSVKIQKSHSKHNESEIRLLNKSQANRPSESIPKSNKVALNNPSVTGTSRSPSKIEMNPERSGLRKRLKKRIKKRNNELEFQKEEPTIKPKKIRRAKKVEKLARKEKIKQPHEELKKIIEGSFVLSSQIKALNDPNPKPNVQIDEIMPVSKSKSLNELAQVAHKSQEPKKKIRGALSTTKVPDRSSCLPNCDIKDLAEFEKLQAGFITEIINIRLRNNNSLYAIIKWSKNEDKSLPEQMDVELNIVKRLHPILLCNYYERKVLPKPKKT